MVPQVTLVTMWLILYCHQQVKVYACFHIEPSQYLLDASHILYMSKKFCTYYIVHLFTFKDPRQYIVMTQVIF